MKHGGLGKTISRILVFCLLLGCFTCHSNFLGPGISSAQALIGSGQLTPVTQTDVVFPSASVTPMATTTRVNNILVAINLNKANIRYTTFDVKSSSTATTLQFYDYTTAAKPYLWADDMTDDATAANRKLDVIFEPNGAVANGTRLMYCGYNSTSAASTALNHISVIGNGAYAMDGSVYTGTTALAVTKVYLGDVNSDGAVNAVDAQKVLQFAAGTTTLTATQKLAADVNRDGAIDAVDAMKINQYAVSKILSFWGTDAIEDLPDSGPSGITSGGIYYLKNGKYVYGDSDLTCNLKNFTNNTTSSNHNFIVEFSGALCTIRNGLNGKYLQLDTDYNATFKTTNVISFSSFWYFVPVSGGGYRLVNYANPHRMLNIVDDVCVASRLYSGSVWTFEPLTVNIKYFYDSGYKARVSSNTAASIQQYQADIRDIISTVFKVSATTSTPQTFQSYGDKCYGSASVTSNNVDKYCDHANNTQCLQYHFQGATQVSQIANVHHKNGEAAVDYLYLKKQLSDPRSIQLLISGYKPCGAGDDGTHSWNNSGGLTVVGGRTSVVFNTQPSTYYCDKLSVLHELSHAMGALLANGSPKDDSVHASDCVMSYRSNNNALNDYWDEGNYRKLYCTKCYQAIVKGLSSY